VDGGLLWNRLTPANWAIISVLIHPKNSDRLVIGVEGQGTKTSARPLTAVVNDMAFGRGMWWAATEDGLLASNDRGATWTVVSVGLPPGQPVHSVRLSADGSRIWLASPRALAVSRDGGKNWTSQDLGFEARSRLRLDQSDDGTLFVSHNYGVYASGDDGKSWKPLDLLVPIVQDFVVIGNALVLSTQKDGLRVSYNRGRTWEHMETPLAEAYFLVLTAGAPAPVLLAGSSTEGVYSLEIPAASRTAVADAQTSTPAVSRSAQK
jgi:photosystem II stability/assembly factor-like uncharacterized protein